MASPQNTRPALRVESILAQGGSRWDDRTGSVSMPIYQGTTFRHPALGESTGFDYSRTSNPTRQELERVLAELEGGNRALAFSSGMAAIDCILRLFAPGDRLLVLEDLYGGTWRLLERIYKPLGIQIEYIPQEQFTPATIAKAGVFKALFLETPTNPTLKVVDLPGCLRAANQLGALTVVDNTFLTALLQRPLDHGADMVVYSASKFLGGHNDVLAGAVVTKDPDLGERLAQLQNTSGAVLGPMDSWLLLRGLKTLPLRIRQQQENAQLVAEWLSQQPQVAAVHYPGLPSDPGYTQQHKQAQGSGAMVSFSLKDPALVEPLLRKVQLWIFAESLGGVESLITLPYKQTHADVPEETRLRLGISNTLFRLSVGIENSEDLISDLKQALQG